MDKAEIIFTKLAELEKEAISGAAVAKAVHGRLSKLTQLQKKIPKGLSNAEKAAGGNVAHTTHRELAGRTFAQFKNIAKGNNGRQGLLHGIANKGKHDLKWLNSAKS